LLSNIFGLFKILEPIFKLINRFINWHQEKHKRIKHKKSIGFDKLQKAIRARRNAGNSMRDNSSMPTDNYERKD